MTQIRCEVVPVELTPHPNADSLSIVKVFDYPVIVKTEDWVDKQFGVYIPVDAVVPDGVPAFAFLEGHNRIRAKKLRGIFSQGLLMPLPENYLPGETIYFKVGDDLAGLMGVTKYEPPEPHVQGMPHVFADAAPPPSIELPRYTDIEHLRRYATVFEPGEPVAVTEKIHGANARYVWCDDQLYCGSHKQWRKEVEGDPWWGVATPAFREFVKDISPCVVFGEIYGAVQDLKYGKAPGEIAFRMFDIYNPKTGKYVDYSVLKDGDLLGAYPVELAPEIWQMPFDLERIEAIAEQDSLVGGKGHIMEGVVVRPLVERYDHRIGRVILKLHSQRYLLRKGG